MARTLSQQDNLEHLLSLCALGNELAFEQLYQATSAKLFAVALRTVKRKDWAEDILQEAFVNIWHKAHEYHIQKAAAMTWMTHIVRNRAVDWLRRPQHEVLDEDNSIENSIADETLGLFEQLNQAREQTALNECMKQLDAKNREAIALAFWQGLSHSELAQRLQQPIGTIKTWIRRGLVTLKLCFGEIQ